MSQMQVLQVKATFFGPRRENFAGLVSLPTQFMLNEKQYYRAGQKNDGAAFTC